MPSASGDVFLSSRQPLRPQHAVVALLLTPDGRYVLQLRDPKPEIFYPDHWGCFGGAVETGESPVEAIVRELNEELGLTFGPQDCRYFTEFTFDFGFAGGGVAYRRYFTVVLRQDGLDGITLNEGAAIEAFTGDRALGDLRLVPYDAFAIWLHHHRDRMQVAGGNLSPCGGTAEASWRK
jgi:8-oxo-dGTP pyrophosphatase MutT (NUDIX family)